VKRATFTEAIEAVDFADMLVTLQPGLGLLGAVDVACDARRREALLGSKARRAA
jgi:hypothetical protein